MFSILLSAILFVFVPLSISRLPSQCPSTLHVDPTHTVVRVSNVSELDSALASLTDSTTILIDPGEYLLSDSVSGQFATPVGHVDGVTIRGSSENPVDVVIRGNGNVDPSTEFGFNIGDASNVIVGYLTIEQVYFHGITFSPEANDFLLHRVNVYDTGAQAIKVNSDGGLGERTRGTMECCNVGYASKALSHPSGCGTNGILANYTSGLIVRHNRFFNFDCEDGSLCGPAVMIWDDSEDSLIEANLFENCSQGIFLGMTLAGGGGHTGGIVRNNVFVRSSALMGDVGVPISSSSPNAVIAYNTIINDNAYPSSIEVRYASTTGNEVVNNLVDTGTIWERDSAIIARNEGNILGCLPSWFVGIGECPPDAHLASISVPPVGAGVECEHVPVDFDQVARGLRLDVGAFEYVDAAVDCPGEPDCSGRGTCHAGEPPFCDCHPGFTGLECERVQVCPGTPECSSAGTCVENGVDEPFCECDDGYTEHDCSALSCGGIEAGILACSGHGSCIGPNECACTSGWHGSICRYEVVPGAICDGIPSGDDRTCSSHGTCRNLDVCECDYAYVGSFCQNVVLCGGVPAFDASVCTGHGSCFDGSCRCDGGYYGPLCADSQPTKPLGTAAITAIAVSSSLAGIVLLVGTIIVAVYLILRCRSRSSKTPEDRELEIEQDLSEIHKRRLRPIHRRKSLLEKAARRGSPRLLRGSADSGSESAGGDAEEDSPLESDQLGEDAPREQEEEEGKEE